MSPVPAAFQGSPLIAFGRDLTAAARGGQLDPVIRREPEIRRVIQVLSRRTKSNPMLLGEPGVGKTAVVEGLAQRIADGAVPATLQGTRLVTLDLAGLMAGTEYRGTFEDRFTKLLHEAKESNPRTILFIDEIHTIVRAGAVEGGSLDVANMLKPALARGELRCVGATTQTEYERYFARDAALERRFQPVTVREPGVGATIVILAALKDTYEKHHGVRIRYSALVTAARLAHEHLKDRRLPDKAIDLIDEAAARCAIERDAPGELEQLRNRVHELDVIARARGDSTHPRLDAARRVARFRLAQAGDKLKARRERSVRLAHLTATYERLNRECAEAEARGDLVHCARLRYGQIPGLLRQMEEVQKVVPVSGSGPGEVRPRHVASVLSEWSGIPLRELSASLRRTETA